MDDKFEKKPRKEFKSDRSDRDDRFRGGDDDGDKSGFSRRRRGRPALDATFDYKDLETLRQYISEDGKIVAARITRLNSKQQKELTNAIKRARQLALIPVSSAHLSN